MSTSEGDLVLRVFTELAFSLVESDGFVACDGDGERLVLNGSRALRFEIGSDSKLRVFVESSVDIDGDSYSCWVVDCAWCWDLNDPEVVDEFMEFVLAAEHLS